MHQAVGELLAAIGIVIDGFVLAGLHANPWALAGGPADMA
jgi:hypothetical protein